MFTFTTAAVCIAGAVAVYYSKSIVAYYGKRTRVSSMEKKALRTLMDSVIDGLKELDHLTYSQEVEYRRLLNGTQGNVVSRIITGELDKKLFAVRFPMYNGVDVSDNYVRVLSGMHHLGLWTYRNSFEVEQEGQAPYDLINSCTYEGDAVAMKEWCDNYERQRSSTSMISEGVEKIKVEKILQSILKDSKYIKGLPKDVVMKAILHMDAKAQSNRLKVYKVIDELEAKL